MKPNTIFLTVLFTIVGIISLNAQEFIISNSTSNLKRGIYRSFEEFKNNAPSLELEHEILKTKKKTGGIIKGNETTFYHLNVGKNAAKKIGKVYGFSDGENIYINEFNPKLKPKVLFMKIGFAGNYCVFEYKTSNNVNSLLPRNKVVDMRTGNSKIVSKKTLMNFINTNTVSIDNTSYKTTSAIGK